MAIEITTVTLTNPNPIEWEAPRNWRCHHCGASGTDPQDTDKGTWVLADGVTYLRSHCTGCLPPYTGAQYATGREWTPEYRAHYEQDSARRQALAEAVRTGQVEARGTDLYRCSVGAAGDGVEGCSGAFHIGMTVVLPFGVLYDRGTDLYEHPCSVCWARLAREELETAHKKRVGQLR